MGLFNSDLYRSLAIGFVLGTLGMLGVMGASGRVDLGNKVIPVAEAAPALPDQTR